jgi:hypothetical protein
MGGCTQQLVEQVLGVDGTTAAAVLRSLIEEEYLECDDQDTAGARWRTTIRGNALAQASAAAPVTRATAARAVDALLHRVRQINADEELPYVVEQVILFGSYLGDGPTVNDVDVAVRLRRRSADDVHFQRQCRERVRRARSGGRTFRSTIDQVLWPQLEIMRILKSGSRVLSLHDAELETELLLAGAMDVVYSIDTEAQ